jgi:hypothetical protein
MNEFSCVRVARSELVAALLGQMPKHADLHSSYDRLIESTDALLVFSQRVSRRTPCAIVVREDSLSDFLVWIETYAPQFFPISQWCRVLSDRQMRFFETASRYTLDESTIKAFSGMVVGELMGQASGDPLRFLETANLSLVQSTFAFAFARTKILWPDDGESAERVSRSLEMISQAGLMPERRLTIDSLQPILEIAGSSSRKYVKVSGAWKSLLLAVEELRANDQLSDRAILDLARYFEPAMELVGLSSLSAESRVHIFDALLSKGNSHSSEESQIVELFCLAYAAVEIGGGTTRHMNLLVPIGEQRPAVWVWFGMIASLGEKEKWHSIFARLARLVARELGYSFDLSEQPRTDISLQELMVYGRQRKGSWAASIPRAQARTLSVELTPGVPLHVPIALSGQDRRELASQAVTVDSEDFTQLEVALQALWNLRQKFAQNLGPRVEGGNETEKRKRPIKQSKQKAKDLFR